MGKDEINEINQKLQDYARNSKNIMYSIDIFKEQEDNNKKPKIVLREVIKEGKYKDIHIWAIVLKYVIEDIPQEVIIGTLGDTYERKGQAAEIIDFIGKQLRENTIPGTGYEYVEDLYRYIQDQSIPFEFSIEGLDILTNKKNEKTSLIRTYALNEQSKVQYLFPEHAIKTMAEGRITKMLEESNKIKELKKWNERRDKILTSFKTADKRKNFISGEKITQFMEKADNNMAIQKNMVLGYLQDGLENEENSGNPKSQLFKGYLQMKEKGLAIDAKVQLENSEDEYYGIIRQKKGKDIAEEWAYLDEIKEYEKFFDLVKEGRDWNARLNFTLILKDFNFARDIIEKKNDGELLEYLNLKEKMINDVKLAEIEADSSKHESVRELNEFLMNSRIRRMTGEKEENFILKIYEHIKRLIVENNFESIELYNKYAEKSNRYVCEIPDKKRVTREKYISDLTRDILNGKDITTSKKEHPEQEEQEGR